MPPLERTDLRQRAVLWPAIGRDRFGQSTVGSPVEIRVRWLDTQTSMLDAQGNTVTIDATAIVEQDIPLGSQMWLGTLNNLPGTGLVPERGLMEVKKVDGGLDLKARNVRRTVGLIRVKYPSTAE